MPRKPRLAQQAVCYHLLNRGVNRMKLFHAARDYRHFSELVREAKDDSQVNDYEAKADANSKKPSTAYGDMKPVLVDVLVSPEGNFRVFAIDRQGTCAKIAEGNTFSEKL